MGSIRINAVLFKAYSDDHLPRHVHAFYAEMEAIIDLQLDGTVSLSERTDNVRPNNARRSDVKKILQTASESFNPLLALWEKNHG